MNSQKKTKRKKTVNPYKRIIIKKELQQKKKKNKGVLLFAL